MGSKPKTSQQQGKKGIFGMGPGQSQAMAGNTGLAGISEKQAKSIIDTNKQLNKTFNNNRPSTYMSLGQEIGEVGSKYRRPADAEKYAAEMQVEMLQELLQVIIVCNIQILLAIFQKWFEVLV